jgi:hypothetical protein
MNFKGTKDKTFICLHCTLEFKFKSYSSNHIFCNKDCERNYRLANKQKLRDLRYIKWINNEDLGIKNPRRLIRDTNVVVVVLTLGTAKN